MRLVNSYRCASGNRPIFKNESARVMLKILKDAGTIGILADQNTMPEEGVFVDFFGKAGLHDDGNCARGAAYGCGSCPGIRGLG